MLEISHQAGFPWAPNKGFPWAPTTEPGSMSSHNRVGFLWAPTTKPVFYICSHNRVGFLWAPTQSLFSICSGFIPWAPKTELGILSSHIRAQGADPFPTSSTCKRRQVKLIWTRKLPPPPPGMGERFSQTISNLGHAALVRRCELPL